MIHFRTVCLSAHLDAFCSRLNELTKGAFTFIYQTEDQGAMRRRIGWNSTTSYDARLDRTELSEEAGRVDVLVDMLREIDLFEARCKTGLQTYYWCERWFKPVQVGSGKWGLWSLPGWVRLFVPRYFKMARRFAKLMDDEHFHLLPCGVHAARDFIRVYDFFHGKWWRILREPRNRIERTLGGVIEGFPRMKLWAYFVSPSMGPRVIDDECKVISGGTLKVLWAGRMIGWKRVDVLVKAVRRVVESGRRKIELTLIGEGPERSRLERLAKGAGYITFSPYVKNDQLRKLMREADLYVMPSDGEEGWGAAVSEALSEGCPVISTFEAGSSATLLAEACLYHANSVDELSEKLVNYKRSHLYFNSEDWSGDAGAMKLWEMCR